jgi:transcriptional regulator with XRE-family HTH domain
MLQSKKIKQAVGLRLKAIREQVGCTMREMAVRLHITSGAYSKNERGLNFPGLDTLKCLARDFDISMDWLIFEKGPMYNKEKEQREKELEQTVETLKQTVQTLEQNLEGLKGQLEEERKKQEKAAQARATAIEMNPEVKELLDNLERDPIFYHKLMLNFQEHKLEKKEFEESSKKKTGTKTERFKT